MKDPILPELVPAESELIKMLHSFEKQQMMNRISAGLVNITGVIILATVIYCGFRGGFAKPTVYKVEDGPVLMVTDCDGKKVTDKVKWDKILSETFDVIYVAPGTKF